MFACSRQIAPAIPVRGIGRRFGLPFRHGDTEGIGWRRGGRQDGHPRGAETAADKAALRAKAAGATGPNGSAATRALRDSAIIARAACGVPAPQIAEEFEISARRVRAVLEQARKAPSPLDRTPMELVEELLAGHHRIYCDLVVFAAACRESNPPVALGALKAAGVALDRLQGLLELTGKLPDLDRVRGETELYRLGELILERLANFEAGAITAAGLRRWIEDAILSDDPFASFTSDDKP